MSTTLGRQRQVLHPEAPTRSRWPLRQLLLLSGVAASAIYVVANVAGALRWDGYSTMDQQVSELFAVDAPSRPLVVSILAVHAVLALAFGIGVLWAAHKSRALRVAGWALIGVGIVDQFGPFFPMHMREVLAAGGGTFTDTMHITLTALISLLTVVAMIAAAVALGRAFRIYTVVTVVGLLAGGLVAASGAGALQANEPTPWMGLAERIDIGAYLLWMAVLALALVLKEKQREAALTS
jgi:Protein of unknown function (DUF998)